MINVTFPEIYYNTEFESSMYATKQFDGFVRLFKREFKRFLNSFYGVKKLEFSKGHFYVSGFFELDSGEIYYFSTSDVRTKFLNSLLIRTAKDFKDYKGGENNFITMKEGNSTFVIDFLKYLPRTR